MTSLVHRSNSTPRAPRATEAQTSKQGTQAAKPAKPADGVMEGAVAAPIARGAAAAPRLGLKMREAPDKVEDEITFRRQRHQDLRRYLRQALEAGPAATAQFIASLQLRGDFSDGHFHQTLLATAHAYLAVHCDADDKRAHQQAAGAAFAQMPHSNVALDLLEAGTLPSACAWLARLAQAHPERARLCTLKFLRAGLHLLKKAQRSAEAPDLEPLQRATLWALDRLLAAGDTLSQQTRVELIELRVLHLNALGRRTEARAALRDLEALRPETADASTVMAHSYAVSGDRVRAAAWLESAWEKPQQDADVLKMQIDVAEGLHAAGVPILERAIQGIAAAVQGSQLPAEQSMQVLTRLAHLQMESAPERALELFLAARTHAPLAPQTTALLSMQLARDPKRRREAHQVLLHAIEQNPQTLSLRHELLAVAKGLGDTALIAQAYRALVPRDVDHEDLQREAADFFLRLQPKALVDAAQALILAAKQDPYDVALCFELARVANAAHGLAQGSDKRGNLRSEAMRALERILQVRPRNPAATLQLAHMRCQTKPHSAAALALYEAALKGHNAPALAHGASTVLGAQMALLRGHKRLPAAMLARFHALEARANLSTAHSPCDMLQLLMQEQRAWLTEARAATHVPAPVEVVHTAPRVAPAPASQSATADVLHTPHGQIVGLNWHDEAVVRTPSGALAWRCEAAYAHRWLRHAPDALAAVPAAQRHRLPAGVRAELDALLHLKIVGERTLGDFVGALAGHAPNTAAPENVRPQLCVLRGSRVHHVLLKHFAEQAGATPQAHARLRALAERAQSGVVADIDLGTSMPPQQVYDRCIKLAPERLGACGAGGVATTLYAQFHGVTAFHDHPGAALHLDVASFCVENSLAGKEQIAGAHVPVYPKVFGTSLHAWARVQAFAPLFYNFHSGEILDPLGTAWADLQAGVLRIASEAGHANPMLALLAAKQAPLQLALPAADLQIIRAEAARQLQPNPSFAASLMARAAPEGLSTAAALLAWARGPLRQGLKTMHLGHVYTTCFAPCSAADLAAAYGRRAAAGTFSAGGTDSGPVDFSRGALP